MRSTTSCVQTLEGVQCDANARGNVPDKAPLSDMAAALPRVLVVEDEPLVRMLIATHLAEHGFSVVEAASADEAVSVLSDDGCVVLVFSDIQMPDANDGIDLAKWIASERPELKVLLTSGRPAPEAARPWPFVAKPYRLDRVEKQVREMAGA